jgi:predicted  nucleic acid-binding Zn-ribbon protein
MNQPTATPRTDAALYPMNGVDIVWPEFARTLERELAETERLRFGADAERRQLRCDLFDAKWECERLKFALVEWEAKERGWSKAVEKDAAELARLRALVGTIRSQLNLTVRNVSDITPEEHSHETGEAIDHLRAEVERWETVAAEMSQEREHNANEASRLRAELQAKLAAMKDTPTL